MLKVIFHIDEMDKWKLVLGNAKNMLNAEPDSGVAVLANSEAVRLYADRVHEQYPVMLALAAEGVSFIACRNALKLEALDEDALPPEISVVPAGVAELAKKQHSGYAYIRP